MPAALTIAGSDPSGGAGIQADLKTFHQHRVYGMAVLTLLTVQNTQGVRQVRVLQPGFVVRQIETVLEDIPPQAIKTGALGNAAVVRALACCAKNFKCPLVVDPVMISKHGSSLLPRTAVCAFMEELLPRATLVTPNLKEASVLSGIKVRDLDSMEKAAKRIAALGPQAVLVKGGHLGGPAADLLYQDGRIRVFSAARVRTRHTHGTGCTYAAAITAELAKGRDLPKAIELAKKFITQAIRNAPGLGRGCGPVDHHAGVC
ncbi:MAG: bifunctional hydroxymethylpyrimidine kinase/phosphomethylpyrimidine kinase [Candidatus Omnitrophica bacterium]|nr:bifunctional hydroxymethylpyrimidine kinase/phosphomethylpyrimidine kinase [Candidatus Omnitrophota bacterium]